MAQTTGAFTLNNLKIEISTSGWPTGAIDVSGIDNSLDISGGDTGIVKAFTFGTGTPVLAPGTKDDLKVKLKLLYSENTGDNYAVLAAAYEANPPTPIQVRYSPKGGTTGNFRFTSGTGYIVSQPYPSGNAEGKEFATFEVTFDVPNIVRSTI